MKIKYKSNGLPLNFTILGYMLLVIGVWRIIVVDWKGILLLSVSVFLVFFKTGFIIDIDKKLLKKYAGILFIRKGEWESIKLLKSILVIKSKEMQTMSVLSISRTETNIVYKLYLNMPDRKIQVMNGCKKDVFVLAKEIASSLHVSIKSNAEEFLTDSTTCS